MSAPMLGTGNESARQSWWEFGLAVVLIALGTASRLLPHPPNFTPIGALGLFGGFAMTRLSTAALVPFAALLLSDWYLGWYTLLPVVYACFGINVLLGRWLQRRPSVARWLVACLGGSLQFFLITNFGCWLVGYPKTWEGLTQCYVLALPFYRNQVLGDLLYGGVLCGGLVLARRCLAWAIPTRTTT
jgi:hypothetical protein